MENLLVINNLTKTYPKFKLDNVSFKVPAGTIMGFIGRNGAGKTTTLKSIMNIIHYDSGEILAFNKNIKGNEKEIKQDIAFSLCEMSYYQNKTIKQLTNVTSRFYKSFSFEKFDKLCKLFSLDKNKKIEQLSSGMKVKYSLAVALSHDAKLIILDEPTSGLDPISRDEILEIFLKLVKDKTRSILFSTHITSDLDKCANCVTYIHNGKIVFTGDKKEFINDYHIISSPFKSDVDKIKKIAISYKEHENETIGLIKNIDKNKLTTDLKLREPTLEEIMVFLELGDKHETFDL